MIATADETTPDETLAEERRFSPRAGAAAIGAGLLTMLGSLLVLSANQDFPEVRVLDALRAAFDDGPATGTGLVARKVLYYDDHAVQIIATQLVPSIALALVGVMLTFLYRATKARNPQMNKLPIYAAVAGAVLVFVPAIVAAVALTIDVSSFAGSANQSEEAARAVLDAPLVASAYYLVQLGTFSIGLAFVFMALNAMKVGLLTRFMGVLGVIVGVLFVIPLESQLPLVKVFWLLALGAVFLDHWPGGRPPAWASGVAEPWPTQQEIREAKLEARGERAAKPSEEQDKPERRPRRGRAEPPETPAPAPPPSKPHSSSKKKKRKRR